MLGGVEFGERLLQSFGVGGDLWMLDPVAGGGEAGVGLLDALLDGGELAGFEIRKFFLAESRRSLGAGLLFGA